MSYTSISLFSAVTLSLSLSLSPFLEQSLQTFWAARAAAVKLKYLKLVIHIQVLKSQL